MTILTKVCTIPNLKEEFLTVGLTRLIILKEFFIPLLVYFRKIFFNVSRKNFTRDIQENLEYLVIKLFFFFIKKIPELRKFLFFNPVPSNLLNLLLFLLKMLMFIIFYNLRNFLPREPLKATDLRIRKLEIFIL